MKFMNVQAASGILKLSKIVKGTDYFGVTIPEEQAFALMDRYMELGGNTIDTARIYGKKPSDHLDEEYSNSEPIVGRWIKARGNRKDIVLVTKGAHHVMGDLSQRRVNKECIDYDLSISLRELGVDYVDIYFLHRDDPAKPVNEIMDALHEHVKGGRIRALGASNWTTARINEANAYAKANGKTPFSISQIQWGVAYTIPELWNDPTLVCMNETEYAGYLKNGIPVMGYAPQGGGYFSKLLAGETLKPKIAARYDNEVNRRRLENMRVICEETGKSAAEISIAYISSNPVQGAAIVGCSTIAQLEDSMSGGDFTLDEEACARLVK
ncbi:aldo/keto reductase [Oscillospiraceae bacterium PP1C4]